ELAQAIHDHLDRELTRTWQRALPDDSRLQVGAMHERVELMFDELRLSLFNDQHGAFAGAKILHLFRNQRVRYIETINRQARIAMRIGQTKQLQRTVEIVEEATLNDDADVAARRPEPFVESMLFHELDPGWPALLDLLHLVEEVRRRQHDAARITHYSGCR